MPLLALFKLLSLRQYGIILCCVFILGAALYLEHHGYKRCQDKQLLINKNQQEKFDAIANKHIDYATLIKRLRNGSY